MNTTLNDMAGCPGCLTSEKERQALIDTKRAEAKAFAIANACYVILYVDPIDGNLAYMKASVAHSLNISGVAISPH